MVTINGGILTLLICLALFGCLFFLFTLGKEIFVSVLATTLLSVASFGFGYYVQSGFPLTVNEKGSVANLVAGHYYKTLMKVPGVEEKNAGEKTKSGLFVIKDGGSEKVLLIHIDQEILPPYFTMNDKKAIIALPAPALTIESPVAPK